MRNLIDRRWLFGRSEFARYWYATNFTRDGNFVFAIKPTVDICYR